MSTGKGKSSLNRQSGHQQEGGNCPRGQDRQGWECLQARDTRPRGQAEGRQILRSDSISPAYKIEKNGDVRKRGSILPSYKVKKK
jgi:hypothetical protein